MSGPETLGAAWDVKYAQNAAAAMPELNCSLRIAGAQSLAVLSGKAND